MLGSRFETSSIHTYEFFSLRCYEISQSYIELFLFFFFVFIQFLFKFQIFVTLMKREIVEWIASRHTRSPKCTHKHMTIFHSIFIPWSQAQKSCLVFCSIKRIFFLDFLLVVFFFWKKLHTEYLLVLLQQQYTANTTNPNWQQLQYNRQLMPEPYNPCPC